MGLPSRSMLRLPPGVHLNASPSSPYYRPTRPPIHAHIKGPLWASNTTPHSHTPPVGTGDSLLSASYQRAYEMTSWANPPLPSPVSSL